MTAATEQYLKDQDTLGQWIEECCSLIGEALSSALYAHWKDWTATNGLPAGSNKSFTQALTERGHERRHTEKGQKIIGISIRPKEA